MQGSLRRLLRRVGINGSSASKKLRRSGKVPGIVYGSDEKPV